MVRQLGGVGSPRRGSGFWDLGSVCSVRLYSRESAEVSEFANKGVEEVAGKLGLLAPQEAVAPPTSQLHPHTLWNRNLRQSCCTLVLKRVLQCPEQSRSQALKRRTQEHPSDSKKALQAPKPQICGPPSCLGLSGGWVEKTTLPPVNLNP